MAVNTVTPLHLKGLNKTICIPCLPAKSRGSGKLY